MKKRFSDGSFKGKYFLIFLVVLAIWFLYLTVSAVSESVEQNGKPRQEVEVEIVPVKTEYDSARLHLDTERHEPSTTTTQSSRDEEARAFLRRKQEKEKQARQQGEQQKKKERDLPALLADTQVRFRELARFSQEQTVKREHNSYDLNYNAQALNASTHSEAATAANRAAVQSLQELFGETFDLTDTERIDSILEEARHSFQTAIDADGEYHRAYCNLAVIQYAQGKHDEAMQSINQAIAKCKEQVADYYAIRAFFKFPRDRKEHDKDVARAQVLNARVTYGRYIGFLVCMDQYPEQHAGGAIINVVDAAIENRWFSRLLLFLEFSDLSFVDLFPVTHEDAAFFLENRYVVLKKFIPNFIRFHIKAAYDEMIQAGKVTLGDIQSKYRYVIANDRFARFLQFSSVDILRRVILNNIIPTYTYFGGYLPKSELAPHSDRAQCEFTVSVNIHNKPHDKPWKLQIGKKALFDREIGNSKSGFLDYPPKEEWADAVTLEGDALLFMGRHLAHWREGLLPEGQEVFHSFLHYVDEYFPKDKKLD